MDAAPFADEETTQPIPHETLAEVAAAWRASLAQSEVVREPDDARTCRLPIVSRCGL